MQKPKINQGKRREFKLINYGKARINSQGIVIRNFRIMPETTGTLPLYTKQKIIFKAYRRKKIRKISEPVITIADGHHPFYYHWICDNLLRLFLVKDSLPTNFKLALPEPFFEKSFVKETLKIIGVEPEKIIVLKKGEFLKSPQVFFPTGIMGGSLETSCHEEKLLALRNKILKYYRVRNKLNFSVGERIFISRSKQKKRIIINQAEVDEVLKKHEFKIVHMEDYSFAQSCSIAYNARVVVGQCGSNLTDILFCQPRAKILELYPKENYGDKNGGTWFYEIAKICDLDLFYQAVKLGEIYINEFQSDMIVDIKQLEKNLIFLTT